MDLLTIVRQCHNDDPWTDESLTPFLLSAPPAGVQIGFLPRSVTQAIKEDVQSGRTHAFGIGQGKRPYTCSSIDIELVWIHDELDTHEKCSKALQGVVESWRDRHLFPDPLQGKCGLFDCVPLIPCQAGATSYTPFTGLDDALLSHSNARRVRCLVWPLSVYT